MPLAASDPVAAVLPRSAVIAERDLGVVEVRGPDRLTYLHSLLSQHFEAAPATTVGDFLYLDAKGSALAAGRAVVRDADVWLVVPSEVAASLATALDTYRFLLDVQVSDRSDSLEVVSIRSLQPVALPGAPAEAMTSQAVGQGVAVRDRSLGVDLIGPREWLAKATAGMDAVAWTASQYEAWRIAAGEPAWGAEIVGGHRAQELGLLPTHVHLRKGCYPGQESIAKIYNLGRPRRALAVLAVDGPAAAGDPIEGAGKPGQITSAAAVADATVALGFVPVGPDGSLPAGALTVNGAPARIVRRVGEGISQPGA